VLGISRAGGSGASPAAVAALLAASTRVVADMAGDGRMQTRRAVEDAIINPHAVGGYLLPKSERHPRVAVLGGMPHRAKPQHASCPRLPILRTLGSRLPHVRVYASTLTGQHATSTEYTLDVVARNLACPSCFPPYLG
jgi:hypothetical protein